MGCCKTVSGNRFGLTKILKQHYKYSAAAQDWPFVVYKKET